MPVRTDIEPRGRSGGKERVIICARITPPARASGGRRVCQPCVPSPTEVPAGRRTDGEERDGPATETARERGRAPPDPGPPGRGGRRGRRAAAGARGDR